MAALSIQQKLRRKMRAEALVNFCFAGGIGLAALLALLVTFAPGYLLGFFATEFLAEFWRPAPPPLSEIIKLSFGGVVLVLVFQGEWRDERAQAAARKPMEPFMPNAKASWMERRKPGSLWLDGDVQPMDWADVLFTGPRWLRFSGAMLQTAFRQWRLDTERCARILDVVAGRGRRVSLEELEKVVPDANRFHVFQQLRDVGGVVFLMQEPAGISLTEELRQELRHWGKIKSEPHFAPSPPPPPTAEPLTEREQALQLLGLHPAASLAEVKTAYRKKIKECHPDRFTRFGADWQKLAEERSKRLNAAYETITQTEAG